MARYKVKFRIKELELEIEGEHQTVPLVKEAIHQQFAGLLKPVDVVAHDSPKVLQPVLDSKSRELESQSRRKRIKGTTGNGDGGRQSKAVDFSHDASRWGSPKQTFKPHEKVVWLLYIIEQQSGKTALGAQSIVKTFNKHFRQAGELSRQNIYRALGKAKQVVPPLLGEDATKTPPEWYLTDEGKKAATKLVDAALGPPNAAF